VKRLADSGERLKSSSPDVHMSRRMDGCSGPPPSRAST
jgi:hypothetical protein